MTDLKRGDSPPDQPRSRLEDEVLEILVKADQPTSFQDHVRRKAARVRGARHPGSGRVLPSFSLARIGPGSLLIGAFAVIFIATLVRASSPLAATILALAGVVMLAMMWVRRYATPGDTNVKRWRGQEVDLSPPPPAWIESLRERFRRPPRF